MRDFQVLCYLTPSASLGERERELSCTLSPNHQETLVRFFEFASSSSSALPAPGKQEWHKRSENDEGKRREEKNVKCNPDLLNNLISDLKRRLWEHFYYSDADTGRLLEKKKGKEVVDGSLEQNKKK